MRLPDNHQLQQDHPRRDRQPQQPPDKRSDVSVKLTPAESLRVARVVEVTNCSPSDAYRLLMQYKWDIQRSVDAHFAIKEASGQKVKVVSHITRDISSRGSEGHTTHNNKAILKIECVMAKNLRRKGLHALEIEVEGRKITTAWSEGDDRVPIRCSAEFQKFSKTTWVRFAIWRRRSLLDNKREGEAFWRLTNLVKDRYYGWISLESNEQHAGEILVDISVLNPQTSKKSEKPTGNSSSSYDAGVQAQKTSSHDKANVEVIEKPPKTGKVVSARQREKKLVSGVGSGGGGIERSDDGSSASIGGSAVGVGGNKSESSGAVLVDSSSKLSSSSSRQKDKLLLIEMGSDTPKVPKLSKNVKKAEKAEFVSSSINQNANTRRGVINAAGESTVGAFVHRTKEDTGTSSSSATGDSGELYEIGGIESRPLKTGAEGDFESFSSSSSSSGSENLTTEGPTENKNCFFQLFDDFKGNEFATFGEMTPAESLGSSRMVHAPSSIDARNISSFSTVDDHETFSSPQTLQLHRPASDTALPKSHANKSETQHTEYAAFDKGVEQPNFHSHDWNMTNADQQTKYTEQSEAQKASTSGRLRYNKFFNDDEFCQFAPTPEFQTPVFPHSPAIGCSRRSSGEDLGGRQFSLPQKNPSGNERSVFESSLSTAFCQQDQRRYSSGDDYAERTVFDVGLEWSAGGMQDEAHTGESDGFRPLSSSSINPIAESSGTPWYSKFDDAIPLQQQSEFHDDSIDSSPTQTTTTTTTTTTLHDKDWLRNRIVTDGDTEETKKEEEAPIAPETPKVSTNATLMSSMEKYLSNNVLEFSLF